MASAAFGSFRIWHIEFLYTHLKDSVVSKRVVFIRWLCRFLFCLSVRLFGWVGGLVGWFVGWLICLVCFFLVLFWCGLSNLFCWLVGWLDVGLFGFLAVW